MSVRNLDKLFKPATVALIGATPRRGAIGDLIRRNLGRDFRGRVMLVNPAHRSIGGAPVHPDVASLPVAPDLAIVATPPETVPGIVAALGARGTRGALIVSGGFDGDPVMSGGPAWHRAALDAARPHLLRLLGPRCVGIMVPGIGLNASIAHLAAPPGDLAFVSQSGAILTALLDWAAPRNIGFSHVVALGDTIDVDIGDMLDYLGNDADTRAILLYVETIGAARKFMSAARAAARRKPVLVVKAGRSAEGARAAARGTPEGLLGKLAGDAVCDAAFRRAGMLRVTEMAELFDAIETLATTRPQRGDRLAILTNGRGPAVLATDALIARGGRMADLAPDTVARLDRALPGTGRRGNPVYIPGGAPGARYAEALAILLEDRTVDAVLAIHCPSALASPGEAAAAVVDAAAAWSNPSGRNLLTSWLGQRSVGEARRRLAAARIAGYDTPDRAVLGFMHRVQYRRNQELLMETPPSRPERFAPDLTTARTAIAAARAAGTAELDPAAAAAVLGAYGLAPAASRGARDAAEAAAMAASLRAARPEALALAIGVIEDPVFGPVMRFAPAASGAAAPAQEEALELPPLNHVLARAQIARTRIGAVLRDQAGEQAVEAVADALVRVAQLIADHGALSRLDIDPILADRAGVMALHARIALRAAAAGEGVEGDGTLSDETLRDGAGRFAIPPYPKELESTARLSDGTALRLRPIRPEDEPALQAMVERMSPEDVRLRFFTPMKTLTHTLAARLTQIDYDREMALVALGAEGDEILGVARYSADPDRRRAEYAVALRSDLKGHGLGYLLMMRLIAVARQRGIEELFGEVLRENEAMLQMCRALGFHVASHPSEPEVVRATLAL